MFEKIEVIAEHPKMGAMFSAGFRVWAPHAQKVYLTGTFNNWSEDLTPLTSEANGYWSVNVPEAKVDDEYRYLIHCDQGCLSRIDPYARKVTCPNGNAVVYDLNPSLGF